MVQTEYKLIALETYTHIQHLSISATLQEENEDLTGNYITFTEN